eukprot:Skav229545  [mRNA]  locus=scaffold568:240027:259515:+ [translate_table: standard]
MIPYSRDILDYFEKADRVVLVDGQRYAAVQYLGFNLFTAPGTEVDGCFDIGDDLDQCYLGSEKVKEDVEKRMKIMFEAVERVYASDHWDRSPTTLKIFMLPEFYWRGRQGAYRIHRGVEKAMHPTAYWISHRFTHERFKHWLIVDGTVVMAQTADEKYVEMSERPYENISYYNFAPVHVGGTNLTYLRFKHFISGIDFLQIRPEHSRMVPAPPGRSHSFCKQHPHSNGCVYQHLPRHLLEELGFGHDVELPSGLLKIGGLRIGLEICLDHAMGELCQKELKPWERVDVQLIVGIDYGADVMVSMQQWLGDSIFNLTGTGFGTRFPGVGTMPGEALPFKQISALGDDWLQQLQGRFTYEATCAAGPFVLSTRWTTSWDLAVKHRQVGRSLETPRFLAEGHSLERGLGAWQRLRQARGMVFEGACNELSLLSQHSPGELANAWEQLRHPRQRVLQRLERLEKKQEPRRAKAERRWRDLAAMNRPWPSVLHVEGVLKVLQAIQQGTQKRFLHYYAPRTGKTLVQASLAYWLMKLSEELGFSLVVIVNNREKLLGLVTSIDAVKSGRAVECFKGIKSIRQRLAEDTSNLQVASRLSACEGSLEALTKFSRFELDFGEFFESFSVPFFAGRNAEFYQQIWTLLAELAPANKEAAQATLAKKSHDALSVAFNEGTAQEPETEDCSTMLRQLRDAIASGSPALLKAMKDEGTVDALRRVMAFGTLEQVEIAEGILKRFSDVCEDGFRLAHYRHHIAEFSKSTRFSSTDLECIRNLLNRALPPEQPDDPFSFFFRGRRECSDLEGQIIRRFGLEQVGHQLVRFASGPRHRLGLEILKAFEERPLKRLRNA